MRELVIDASPLIYLAKLDALFVLPGSGYAAVVPSSVWDEVARPALSFRFPEIATIEGAAREGWITVASLSRANSDQVEEFAREASGLHRGELECLTLAQDRGSAVCFHERQASRIARTLGIATVHVVELLFDGAPDRRWLDDRVRRFARMTNLTMADLDALLRLIEEVG